MIDDPEPPPLTGHPIHHSVDGRRAQAEASEHPTV